MRNKIYLLSTFLFFILLFSASANAQTITSTGTGGNWNATGTWVGGVVPGASNDVVIAAGATVTVTDARSCASIVIQTSTANATNTTLTINTSQQLTVSGTITIGNNVAMANGAVNTTSLTVNGTLISLDIFQLPSVRTNGAGGTGSTNLTISSTGSVTATGNINGTSVAGGAAGTATASVIFTGAGSLSLTGSFTTSVFTNAAGSTVNYSGAAQTVREVAYNNLTLSGSGAKTLTNITTVNNNLSMSGSATATTSSAMTVSGNVSLSGTSTLTTGNTFNVTGTLSIGNGTTFTNAGHASTITGTTTVGGGTSGSLVFNTSAANTKIFTGLVTINAGASWTNNTVNSPVSFRNGITNNGTFTAGSGVHTFETNAQALNGTFSIPSITVTGITLTNNNTLTIATALSGTGGLTNAATGTLNIGGTSAITTLTASASGNTVDYNGGVQTVKATTYHHLTLSNSGAKTMTSVTTVNGNLSMSGSATTSGVSGLTVSGNLSLSGTSQFTTAGTVNVTGNLVIGDGTTFTNAGHESTITGTTTVGGGTSGQLVINNSAGTKIFNGLVTVAANGTWNNSGSSNVSFRGGITNNGTFTAGSGVHTFETTAAQSLAGTFSIPSISVSTGVTLTNNNTLTVSASLAGAGGLTNAATGTLNIGGTSDITTLTATASGNTVNYNGAGQTVKATTYHNLALSSSGTKTAGGAIAVNGQLNIASGIILDMAANALSGASLTTTGTGTLRTQNTSATPIPSGRTWSMTVEYNSASAQTIVDGNYTSLNGTGGDRTLSSSGTIGISGTFTPGAGAFTITGSTVDYNGGAQTVAAITYNNLTFSGSDEKDMTSVTTINGDFTVTGLAVISGNDVLTIGGSFIYNSTGTTVLAEDLTVTKVTQENGTLDGDASIEITGTGSDVYEKTGGESFVNIIFTGDNPQVSGEMNNVTVTNDMTLSGDLTVNGTLELNSSSIVILASNLLTLSGPINFNGGILKGSKAGDVGTSNLIIDGAGVITGELDISAPNYLNNFSINRDVTLREGLYVTGDITLDNATLTLNSKSLHFYGNLTANGGGTIDATGSAFYVYGTGDLTLPAITADQFSVRRDGNIILNGAMTAQTFSLDMGTIQNASNLTVNGSLWRNAGSLDEAPASVNNLYYRASPDNLLTSFELLSDASKVRIQVPGNLILDKNLTAIDLITLNTGFLDVNGFDIAINPGGMIDEQSGYLRGTSGSATITDDLTYFPNKSNPGGLGLRMTKRGGGTMQWGNTTITRGFEGLEVLPGEFGINRYYVITPANSSNSKIDFWFRYLPEDLNGNDPNDLQLYMSTDDGTTWTLIPGQVPNYPNNVISKTGFTFSSASIMITAMGTQGDGAIVADDQTRQDENDRTRTDDKRKDNDRTKGDDKTRGDDQRKTDEEAKSRGDEDQRKTNEDVKSREVENNSEIEIIREIPSEFGLVQNYPNPFNPTTTIKFALPESDLVTVKVFDITGREIAELMNGNMNAGFHTVQFDGTNLSSGIYFYKITTGSGFSQIMKMSLIK